MQPEIAYNVFMPKKAPSPFPFPPKRLYLGADVPMRVIRRYARAIAEEFQPDKIILFGSYAYGTPNENSDVDLLVIMPAANQRTQQVRINYRLAAPFACDLLVRTPKEIRWRLEEGESFTTEIVSRGKVLYEKVNESMDQESGRRLRRGAANPHKRSNSSVFIVSNALRSISRP